MASPTQIELRTQELVIQIVGLVVTPKIVGIVVQPIHIEGTATTAHIMGIIVVSIEGIAAIIVDIVGMIVTQAAVVMVAAQVVIIVVLAATVLDFDILVAGTMGTAIAHIEVVRTVVVAVHIMVSNHFTLIID